MSLSFACSATGPGEAWRIESRRACSKHFLEHHARTLRCLGEDFQFTARALPDAAGHNLDLHRQRHFRQATV
jgi:hypothetical protein